MLLHLDALWMLRFGLTSSQQRKTAKSSLMLNVFKFGIREDVA